MMLHQTQPFHCRAFGSGLVLLLLIFASTSSLCVYSCNYSLVNGNCTLKVLVPRKPLFPNFVDCSNPDNVRGFCIDVFESAISILIPSLVLSSPVHYECHNISSNETYDSLFETLSSEKFDALVGDITISAYRSQLANFTQPFLESGIVILSNARERSFSGVLFKPFTGGTWGLLITALVLTGATLWYLERDKHTDAQLQLKEKAFKQVGLITSWLLLQKRESLTNPLAKVCLTAWFFFIILIGSGYTASLTSILTVTNLSQQTITVKELTEKNLSVGYQVGSITENFLKENGINNIVALNASDDYSTMLSHGITIIEEAPYVSVFLVGQSSSSCTYSVSSKLTTGGFGFAFQDNVLASAFSVAVLNLSENGQMQKLQDGSKLSDYRCPSQVQSSKLDLQNTKELFIFLAVALFISIIVYLVKWVRQHDRVHSEPVLISRTTTSNALAAPSLPLPPQQQQQVQLTPPANYNSVV